MNKRTLIIRFGSLGDVLLTSAALVNLRVSFPDHKITYLTKESFGPLVERFGTVDELVTIPDRTGLRDFYRLLTRFDDEHFSYLLDLHGNLRSHLARTFITSDTKVVYPKRRLERFLLTRRHKRLPDQYPHTIDLYNSAVNQIGGRVYSRRPIIHPDLEEATALPRTHGGKARPMVVIAPGAAHNNKQWPRERFAEVAAKLHRDRNAIMVWVATAKDRSWPELQSIFETGSFVEFVDQPVVQLASIMARAQATVANDSGIAHLSSAVGTPVVAVFGPTHPALGFAPRGLFDRVVEVDEYCRPCSRHGRTPCYREKRVCFDRVTPEMVITEVERVLDKSVDSKAALFVDRDGTVIVDKNFLSDPDQIEFEEGAVEALRRAQMLGLKIVVISNQSGVARGFFGLAAVERVHARLTEMLAAQGVEVDAVYYCPHYPTGRVPAFAIACDCRKPAGGMLEEAARQLNIDLRRSWVVGDKLDDFFLGQVTPARALLVRTGKGSGEEQRLRDYCINGAKLFDNLSTAVTFIERACGDA